MQLRKVAWTLLDSSRRVGRFAGFSVGAGYRAEDCARCVRERCPVQDNHPAPHLGGTCGFYGATGDPLDWMMPQAALLDVELYGRVVRHESGWRAGRQRVLGARFARGCVDCLAADPRSALVTRPDPLGSRRLLVAPRCARCLPVWRSPSDGEEVALADLAGLLGTEVSWLDAATSAQVLRRGANRTPRADSARGISRSGRG